MDIESGDTVCMVCLEDVTRQWINLENQNTCENVTISTIGEDIIQAFADFSIDHGKKVGLMFGIIIALYILWPIEVNIVDFDNLIR